MPSDRGVTRGPRIAMRARMHRYVLLALVLASGCATDDDSLYDSEDGFTLQPFHGRFGSPSIVRDGDTLHAYFPIQRFEGDTVHVAHARSADGGAHWGRVGDAL